MSTYPVELTNVIYNPATQAFEARAVVHDPERTQSYACSVSAPITTDFAMASAELVAQAKARHAGNGTVSQLPQARICGAAPEPLPFAGRAMKRLQHLLDAA